MRPGTGGGLLASLPPNLVRVDLVLVDLVAVGGQRACLPLRMQAYSWVSECPAKNDWTPRSSSEGEMSHFMFRWRLRDEAVQALVHNPQDRTAPARQMIAAFGGRMLSFFYTFGEFDGFAICEMPD